MFKVGGLPSWYSSSGVVMVAGVMIGSPISFSTDIPVAVGFAIFSCSVVVLASLVADILYALLDPRIRLFES